MQCVHVVPPSLSCPACRELLFTLLTLSGHLLPASVPAKHEAAGAFDQPLPTCTLPRLRCLRGRSFDQGWGAHWAEWSWTDVSGMALSGGLVFCASYIEICMQQGEKMHFFKLEKFNRLYSCQVRMGKWPMHSNLVSSSSCLKMQGCQLPHFVHANPQNKLNLGMLFLTDIL